MQVCARAAALNCGAPFTNLIENFLISLSLHESAREFVTDARPCLNLGVLGFVCLKYKSTALSSRATGRQAKYLGGAKATLYLSAVGDTPRFVIAVEKRSPTRNIMVET